MFTNGHIGKRITRHLPITAGETCCISGAESKKLVALLFDKQYVTAETTGIPREVSYCNSGIQHEAENMMINYGVHSLYGDVPKVEVQNQDYASLIYVNSHISTFESHGIVLTPIFSRESHVDSCYSKGKSAAYQAVIENIPVIIDDGLSWEQVLEFRLDEVSKKNYRNFRVWISSLSESVTVSEATDIIGQKLDDYNEAINKHGFKTRIGAYKSLLDWRDQLQVFAIAAATDNLSDNSIWAALAAGSVVLGKVLIYGAEQQLQLSNIHKVHREIALVQEIKNLDDKEQA